MSVIESAVCRAQGQIERIPSIGRLRSPRSRLDPRRGKDEATVETYLEVEEIEYYWEDSYRMREMNKQMSPLQPLLDLTLLVLQHYRMYDSAQAGSEIEA